MKRLRACDGCNRHVFVSEQICPFCFTELAPAPEAVQVSVPSSASRAQRLALAAALGGQALLACAQTTPGQLPVQPPGAAGSPAQPAAGNTGGFVPPGVPVYGAPAPIYGAPPSDLRPAGGPAPAPAAGRAAPPQAGQAGRDPGPPAFPAYGLPIAGSPSQDDDAGVSEAGRGAAGSGGQIAAPVYGAPIPEYGAPPPPKD